MPERIIRQFNKLQQCEPDKEWLQATRNFLITKVRHDTLSKEISLVEKLKLASLIWTKRLIPSSVRVISSLIIIGLIGGTAVFARAEYNPSRPLYLVKRTFEKIELVLAVTPQGETKVHIRHALERQREAVKLAQNPSLSLQEKEENINKVIKSLANDLTAAKNSLEIVKESNVSPNQTAALARQISENVKENLEALDEVKVAAASDNVEQTVAETQSSIEQVEDVSIKVLIEEAQKEGIAGEVIAPGELIAIIQNKIDRTAEKIAKINKQISEVDPNQVIILEEKFVGAGWFTVKLNINQVIKEAKAEIITAEKRLAEAKILLSQSQLNAVLDKIKETNEAIKEAGKVLTPVVSPEKEQSQQLEPTGSASSSQTTINLNPDLNKVIVTSQASSTSETTPEVILPVNYAPLGGQVRQSASYTQEVISE